jgi:hypothetical protein
VIAPIATRQLAALILEAAWQEGMKFRLFRLDNGYFLILPEQQEVNWNRLVGRCLRLWDMLEVHDQEDLCFQGELLPEGI